MVRGRGRVPVARGSVCHEFSIIKSAIIIPHWPDEKPRKTTEAQSTQRSGVEERNSVPSVALGQICFPARSGLQPPPPPKRCTLSDSLLLVRRGHGRDQRRGGGCPQFLPDRGLDAGPALPRLEMGSCCAYGAGIAEAAEQGELPQLGAALGQRLAALLQPLKTLLCAHFQVTASR